MGEHGCWKYCLEEDIRRIVGDNAGGPKLSIMADAGKCDYHEDIPPKKDSVIDMVRVATYIHQIPLALDMIKDAHDKGYETTVNLMAVSTVHDYELDEGLDMLAQSEAQAIYVVDSFGALYSEQVRRLVKKYLRFAKAQGKEVGMHAHNNLQLAYANTIEAIILGANYSTPPWPAWAAARAIARWSCCSASCTTRNTTCAPSCTASRTPSNRCAKISAGALICPTCSPACSTSIRAPPSSSTRAPSAATSGHFTSP